MTPAEVPAVLTAARFLWIADRNIARKSDDEEVGLCQAWHRHLAPYTVEEAHAALDALLSSNQKYCPSVGVIVSEMQAIRHRNAPAVAAATARAELAVLPSGREVGEHEQKALDYIAAHPNANWGRVSRTFVDSWITALCKQTTFR